MTDCFQSWYVVGRFTGHPQVRVVRFASTSFCSANGTRNTAFAPVVGGKRQVPVSKLLIKLFEVVQSCTRTLQYVSALVLPEILLKRIDVAGLRHELPKAGSLGVRECFGLESTFYERQERELGGQSPLLYLVDDVIEILAGTLKYAFDVPRIAAVTSQRCCYAAILEFWHSVSAADTIPDVNGRRYFSFRSG